MGIGGKDAKLVFELSSVSSAGRVVLGQVVVPNEIAMHFSKEGTRGTRTDWQAAQPGKPPDTIASGELPDAPALKGAI